MLEAVKYITVVQFSEEKNIQLLSQPVNKFVEIFFKIFQTVTLFKIFHKPQTMR